MNKLVYLGVLILKISKIGMYKILRKTGLQKTKIQKKKEAILCYTNTHSILDYTKTSI